MLTVLFISFTLFLALGMPIAFAMGLSAVLTLVVSGHIPLELIPQKFIVALDSFPLMAVPLFIFTGELMNAGGATRRIIAFVNAAVGHIRGGLSHVCVLANMIFAGVSGSATADCAGIGSVLIPSMTKEGYEVDWAVSVSAAAATIGPIIPPSILMIIYGSMTGLSIGKLFLAGLIPGLMIGLLLMGTGYILAVKRNQGRKQKTEINQLWATFNNSFPSMLAPVIVLGGIVGGFFTATEAGVIAAVYILILSLVYREINFKKLYVILLQSAIKTTTVLFIIACSASFGWILAHELFPQKLVGFLTAVSPNPNIMLFLIIVMMLLVGLFIEGMAAFIIFIPVFIPIVNSTGYDPIHFAVVFVLCIMVGAITPPVSILLFIASGIANAPLRKTSRLIWVFVLPMIVVVLLVAYCPALSTWLPTFLE